MQSKNNKLTAKEKNQRQEISSIEKKLTDMPALNLPKGILSIELEETKKSLNQISNEKDHCE